MAGEYNFWNGSTSTTYSTAGNWSLHVPLATEFVVIPKTATNNVAGSAQSTVDLGGFISEDGGTVTIGTEAAPLQISCPSGVVSLSGSGETWLELKGHATATTVAVSGVPNLHIANIMTAGVAGTTAVAKSISVDADGGTVYVGWSDKDLVKVDDIAARGPCKVKVGKGTKKAGGTDPVVSLTLESTGASECLCSVVTVNNAAGTLEFSGAAITTLNVSGGVVYPNGTTITTATVFSGGELSLSKASSAVTITTLNIHEGGTFSDPYGKLAAGCVIKYYGGTLNTRKPIQFTTAAL